MGKGPILLRKIFDNYCNSDRFIAGNQWLAALEAQRVVPTDGS
jgi:hypothetical protein